MWQQVHVATVIFLFLLAMILSETKSFFFLRS